MTTGNEARAALERGRAVILVTPPTPDQAGALWDLVDAPARGPGGGGGRPAVVIVCVDDVSAGRWADACPSGRRLHVASGLRRTERCLREEPMDVLAGAVQDLAALVQRAALKLDSVNTIVVAWPEPLASGDHLEPLDTLLAAAPTARRIVLCWSPPVLSDFLERHAHRAERIGTPLAIEGTPLPPVAPARYVVAPPGRRAVLVQAALDTLDPKRPLLWNGGALDTVDAPDAVFCLRLPTRDELSALARWGEPIVFVTGTELPYLRSIATTLTPVRLPSPADRAQSQAATLRTRIAALLEARQLDGELSLLDPLFERFDPALVAAALLAILGEEGSGKGEGVAPAPKTSTGTSVRVFVNVGKKDRASAKDLVGALIKEVKITKGDIGRIDVRDTFSVVEVAAGVADRVVRDLSGVTIRGRRALARLDRYT